MEVARNVFRDKILWLVIWEYLVPKITGIKESGAKIKSYYD